jgi:hypothetical protein
VEYFAVAIIIVGRGLFTPCCEKIASPKAVCASPSWRDQLTSSSRTTKVKAFSALELLVCGLESFLKDAKLFSHGTLLLGTSSAH